MAPLHCSDDDRAKRILKILEQEIPIQDEDFAASRVAKHTGDPFRILVVTILSQNCTDVAALRAFDQLERGVGVTAQKLSRTRVNTIESLIRVAGLHKQKARALKKLASIVQEEHSGNFNFFLDTPFPGNREALIELPNVGPKTADVLLSILGHPTISVDTHVERVSKRLGLAPPKARYEQIRNALMRTFPKESYRRIPMYFMALGRKICKAQRPRCPECPINKLCPYDQKTKRTSPGKARYGRA